MKTSNVGFMVVGWGLFAALLALYGVAYRSSAETVAIVVKDKERITTGSGDTISSKFLVYADGEVFENSDSLLFFKWDSSDIQGELEPGHTYTATVAGWRVRPLSMYRNIIAVDAVK